MVWEKIPKHLLLKGVEEFLIIASFYNEVYLTFSNINFYEF